MTIDKLKEQWGKNEDNLVEPPDYSRQDFNRIIKSRIMKNKNIALQYFWASFTLQILVYALLCHVVIKYWGQQDIQLAGLAGIALYIPFTMMLLKKYKRIAKTRLMDKVDASLYNHIVFCRQELGSFYRFKKRYEIILVPISAAIGVFLTFELYLPGGVLTYLSGAVITFVIALLSCLYAIRLENEKNFERPLAQFQQMLDEFTESSAS